METITLTFGDCGENHVGMQKIGTPAKKGLSCSYLRKLEKYFRENGVNAEFYDLCKLCDFSGKAGVLVLRKGIDFFLDEKTDALFEEQKNLEWDRKAYMYGRVVNKRARHNLCYGEKAQEPMYEEKKGRIIAFDEIPLTKKLKEKLEEYTCTPLIGEGNRYYNVKKCGIGYHGDTERKIVVGCRLGENMPLHFNWFHKNEAIGRNIRIDLDHGDVYFMSLRAVGYDWKKRNSYTLRHAAGCGKFTRIK